MGTSSGRRRHASRWSLLVGLVIFVAVAMSCQGSESSSTNAVDIELVTVNGDPTKIADLLSNRPTLVSLWAVWCQPCRRELSELQRIADSAVEVDVLAINIGDDPSRISQYFDEMSLRLPVVIDEMGNLLTALDVGTVPATVLFSSSGDILWRHLGAVSAEQVAAALDTYVT